MKPAAAIFRPHAWRLKLAVGGLFLALLAASPLLVAQESERTADAEDRRSPVVLRPVERTRVLGDMRQYLKGLQEIFSALARDDMETVSTRARELGRINIYSTTLMFPTRAGIKFRELSSLVHEDFEALADNAAKKMNANAALLDLSLTMKHCVSCHEAYRLSDMVHSR